MLMMVGSVVNVLEFANAYFADIVEDVTSNKEVQAVGKYSVEEYNRLKGMKYYLTIQAVNKTSGEVKVFEAVVVVKPWLRKKELVKFAPSQKTMTILQPVW
ncbi:cysteine proteinase inhibitor B-like protein [Tanacetum coccineum]|uniref:Cysteine proteinase inhibitor B-like protein n=1 Tax=Tanacetum coccineum TaxID=301880 RepID=A0ABQ5D768_9ASTR